MIKTSSEDEDERRLQDVFIKTNVSWEVIGTPIDQENNDGDKSSNNQVAKRWTCKDNMTEKLSEMILSYKSSEKYEGVDFESDLVKMYSDIRKMMAELHPSANFGPDITSYKKNRKF